MRARVSERGIARNCPFGVAHPDREGEATARGGQRLKTEARQQSRCAGIPGIGDDKSARTLVQGAEPLRLLRLCGHAKGA